MKLIQDNPYRIAGILSNANARELERQKAKITRYASIGRQVDSELDFPFLGNIDRSESSITKAFSGIEQNQDKVSHSLFWFLKANTFDETAINYLINGDKDKAVEIWDKVTNGKEVTSKNFSCFNNIGTLKLLSDSKDEIKEGLEAKIKLIESSNFADFVHTVADQTYTIDNQKQAEKFVDDVLKQFKGQYSSSDTLKLFSNCNGTTQKYLSQKFTEEPLHNIESQIESTKNKRKTNKSGAYELGLKLFVNCKDDLATLKSLLGISDLKYKMIADNLAKEVMQCGIDYFQEWKESKNPSEEGLKLLKYAQSIAIGSQTKDRIKENINGIEEWAKIAPVKKEFEFILKKLVAFRNANDTIENARDLVSSCKPKLQSMKSILGSSNEEYLNLSTAIANNALGMLVTVINDEQNNPLVRIGHFDTLKTALRGALAVSKEIESLDMKSEQRSHFNTNYSTLKSIASQLGISTYSSSSTTRSTTITSTRTTTSTSSSKSDSDILSYWPFYIIGLGAIIGLANGGVGGLIGGGVIGFFAVGIIQWFIELFD
ncbi:MAG: hypothetical protein ACOX0V_06070 [Bacteroidales bacterium]|jgi:hypothetical protein